MIEVHIKVPKDVMIDALRGACRYSAFFDQLKFYWWRFLWLWFFVAVVDGLNQQGHLIPQHFLMLSVLLLVSCVVGYVQWYRSISKMDLASSVDLKVDEVGVQTHFPNELVKWSAFYSIQECDRYFLIRGANGLSVLPKNDELADVIDYYVKKIPNK